MASAARQTNGCDAAAGASHRPTKIVLVSHEVNGSLGHQDVNTCSATSSHTGELGDVDALPHKAGTREFITEDQLVRFYEKHDPSKIVNVRAILAQYDTDELVVALHSTYGEAPRPQRVGDDGHTSLSALGDVTRAVTGEAAAKLSGLVSEHGAQAAAGAARLLSHGANLMQSRVENLARGGSRFASVGSAVAGTLAAAAARVSISDDLGEAPSTGASNNTVDARASTPEVEEQARRTGEILELFEQSLVHDLDLLNWLLDDDVRMPPPVASI